MTGTVGASAATDPYASLYFDYEHHAFEPPLELLGDGCVHPVAIAGGGPVGLTLALDLARRGIPVVVLEEDDTVNRGSRAVGIARRSIEIFERLGAGSRFIDTGVKWKGGRSFYRDQVVLEFQVPQDNRLKHPPMVSLAQCFVEQYLVDALLQYPHASIRWSSRVLDAAQAKDFTSVTVDTPQGSYALRCEWLVACDGGRSVVRKALGKELEGSVYEGRYLIADIQMKSSEPPGRRVWFDPPAFPGSTIIMHKQPHDIWRIDYQLGPEDDLDFEVRPERVRERVTRFLQSIGEMADWEIDWISPYRAHSLTLDRYRDGRVLFAGDAAHLVPIFGARGLNGGVDDANNLGWKLAYVASGWCAPTLLDSYSNERVDAAHQNLALAEKSTRFMTPPTYGHSVMREAVLSLAVTQPFVRELINPRQVTELRLAASPLRFDDPAGAFDAGPLPGAVCPNLPLKAVDGTVSFLHQHLGRDFTLLVFRDGRERTNQRQKAIDLSTPNPPPFAIDVVTIDDPELLAAFGANDGTAYLVRPDAHVAGRWHRWDSEEIERRICNAVCLTAEVNDAH